VTAGADRKTLLILGASGDLTARLLLPGLGGLLAKGVGEGLSLIGSAADDWDDGRWRSQVAHSFAEGDAHGELVETVAKNANYFVADATAEGDLKRLLDECEGRVIIYFALPPAITEKACRALVGIEVPDGTQLVMEKPFGSDAASAAALNELVTQIVAEEQIHRVDHFLGTSAVLNILGVRFANRVLEPVMDARHVDSVDVVFDESLGLEGRAGYYDAAGALVDMIQSHMLQVLSLVAMEPPATVQAIDVRDGKAQVLRATRVWDDDPVRFSRRARYTAGEIDGRKLPSYVEEEGIDPSRNTETFAEVVLAVDTWRWAGVPFRLRSGKALGSPRTEVTVNFKDPPRIPAGLTGREEPDRLHIGIPLGGGRLALDLNITGPGDPFDIDQLTLDAEFGAGELPPYGEVLKGILRGGPALSVRGDSAVECWRIIEPVQKAWREHHVPLQEYEAGSMGPEGWPDHGLPESR
jgi:glucose-6-phosphate 1-dehydrogenase